jgi:hypothetical protein
MMPYLTKIKTHVCRKPSGKYDHGTKTYAQGTLWQCPVCKKIHKLEYDQREGIIWMETNERP